MRELHLFAGIGGGVLAGHLLGHTPVGAVEIDPYCRRVLALRYPGLPIHDDIKTYRGQPGSADIVSGGFPCQPWSSAGEQRGKDDPRHLWPEMARVVREVRPALVFAENVSIKAFEEPYRDLRGMGYEVQEALCLGAVDVGAPHRRNRWWLLARRADADSRRLPIVRQPRSQLQPGDVPDGLRPQVALASSEGLPLPEQEELRRTRRGHEGRATAERGWWSSEPDVGRVAHGVPDRVGRLRALGNAQVPAVAATAFRILMERAYLSE